MTYIIQTPRDFQIHVEALPITGKLRDDFLCAGLGVFREIYGRPTLTWEDPQMDTRAIGDIRLLWHKVGAIRARARQEGNTTLMSYCSRFLRALRKIGVAIENGRGDPPLTANWIGVIDAVPERAKLIARAFAHWCIRQALEPLDVTSSTVATFAAVRSHGHAEKSTRQLIRQLVAAWNGIALHFGLAVISNPIPYADHDWYRKDDTDFAPRLIEELAAAVQLLAGRRKRGRNFSETLRLQFLRGVSAYCLALEIKPPTIATLDDALDPQRLRTGLNSIIQRAQSRDPDLKRTEQAYEVARAFNAIARVCLPASDPRRKAFRKIARILTSPAKVWLAPVKQQAISPFVDAAVIADFRNAPWRAYAPFFDGRVVTRADVSDLTAACATELMMATNMGAINVVGLEIGVSIQSTTYEGQAAYYIICKAFDGRTTPHWCVGNSYKIITYFIENVRPFRPGAETAFLFGGWNGAARETTIGRAVNRFLSGKTEHRVTSKDVGDAIAVGYAVAHDGSVATVQAFKDRRGSRDPLAHAITAWKSKRAVAQKRRTVLANQPIEE